MRWQMNKDQKKIQINNKIIECGDIVKRIVLVEDEEQLNSLIKTYLEKAGYEVISYLTGNEALSNTDIDAHLWILDIMLGDDVSGFDILKDIKSRNENMPVIFTSARDKDLDKIIGLELGSDDYITKPYSPKELVLRVNNLIKRVYTNDFHRIVYDKYVIDIDKRMVFLNDDDVNLTTLEFDLLYMFVTNKNKSFSRDDILNNIWGNDYFGNDRVVDDLIRRLRKKMPSLNINTIYGYGYRLT